MKTRMKLHKRLLAIADDYDMKVYFQPPSNVRMSYPCIVYTMSDIDVTHADNGHYLRSRRYQLTVILRDPENTIVDRILSEIPFSTYTNSMIVDGLTNHIIYCYVN